MVLFVIGMKRHRMHQHDGEVPRILVRTHLFRSAFLMMAGFIERSRSTHPWTSTRSIDLDDALAQRRRKHDLTIEQPGAILVADSKRIAKTTGDHQYGAARPCARAARWSRRSFPCGSDHPLGGNLLPLVPESHQPTDTFDRGVLVVARSFSDSSLCVVSVPCGVRAMMSVKVPPRSIQNCQRSLMC